MSLDLKVMTCWLIASMLLLVPITTIYGQSGWTQKKGNYFAKLYGIYGSSDEYYNLGGSKVTTAQFTQIVSGFYLEYGLTDKFTLIANGPKIKQQFFETTEKVTAVGDLPLGVKYGILQGNFPLAASFAVDIPLAKEDNFAQNKEIAFERINLPAGDGEWNYKIGLAGSHSFYPVPLFVSLHSSYNIRTKYNDTRFSDQLMGGIEVGSVLNGKFIFITGMSFQKSLGSSKVVDFVRGEGTEFTSIKASAGIYLTKKVLIDLSYFNYLNLIIPRKNLYSAHVFSLGLVYELKE